MAWAGHAASQSLQAIHRSSPVGYLNLQSSSFAYKLFLPSKSVFTSESGRQWSFFEWIIDGGWFSKEFTGNLTESTGNISDKQRLTYVYCYIVFLIFEPNPCLNLTKSDNRARQTGFGRFWIDQSIGCAWNWCSQSSLYRILQHDYNFSISKP